MKVGSPYHERHQEFERVMRECGVKVTNFELRWNRFEEEYFESVVRNILQKMIHMMECLELIWLQFYI